MKNILILLFKGIKFEALKLLSLLESPIEPPKLISFIIIVTLNTKLRWFDITEDGNELLVGVDDHGQLM